MRGKKTIKKIAVLNILILLMLLLSMVIIIPPTIAPRATDNDPDNDTFSGATTLNNDTSQGNVDQNDERDYYKVALDAGQTLSVVYTTQAFGTETALVLYNGNYAELWNTSWLAHDVTVRFNYTINQTVIGPYYLLVLAQDTGNGYDLEANIIQQNDAGQNKDAGDRFSTALDIYQGLSTGFLSDEDVDDFYKFAVPAGSIINLNFSVSKNYTAPVKFEVINEIESVLKVLPNIVPGNHRTYRYTTNNTAPREFTLRATITDGRNDYNISLKVDAQDDASSGGDLGDNLSTAVTIEEQDIAHASWLGGGNIGDDDVDVYKIPVTATEKNIKLNITLTPSDSLDLMVEVYNDTFSAVLSKNLQPGKPISIEHIMATVPLLYISVRVDSGKSVDGEYTLRFKITSVSGSEVDTDNDKMPDEWETEHGLNKSDPADADKDLDSDGLKNLAEYQATTDPTNDDTDSDGMKDGWEVNNGLKPLDDDSGDDLDSDGYTNLQEFQNHTDPDDRNSKPVAGYEHLTAEAVKRNYIDASEDVRYWRGSYNGTTETQTIEVGEVGDYPSFDLLDLSAEREGDDLVVRLKLKGKIDDHGYIETRSRASETFSTTFYWVAFVNKSYSEPKMTDESGLQFIDPWDEDIMYTLIYINNTSLGTLNTKFKKLDNSQTLEWRVPLVEIATLKTDFKLYGIVTHFWITTEGDVDNFEAHFDSMGHGSIPLEDTDTGYWLEESKEIDKHLVSVLIKTADPTAQITIDKAGKPGTGVPAKTGDLGIYMDIRLLSGATAQEIFITIGYNDSNIPEGYSEKDIKIFYYNTTLDKWVRVSNSGVWTNNNTAWARPKHLTIFAPMAWTGGEDDDEPDNWLLIIVLIIIIIIIIILVVTFGVWYMRKKSRRAPPPEPRRPQRALTPEFYPCPRCRAEIEIPYAETQKVGLECPECGARGKIDNPYLQRHERERERDQEREYDRGYDYDYDRGAEEYDRRESERERDNHRAPEPSRRREEKRRTREVELEYRRPPRETRRREYEPELEEEKDYDFKACPKCGKDIAIPYEDDEKILLTCPYCGAQGKVTNPYI
ncbi:hypothetical protein [[Eubacterium] cellulosolvens]